MEKEYIYIVEQSFDGERIDKYLSLQMEKITRSHIQKLIKENRVYHNESFAKANIKLKAQDCIKVIIPEIQEMEIVPENIPLDILYEDKEVLVVNKPKGMVVHPSAGHDTGTLVHAVMYHCKDDLSGINGELRPGIVHRIDRDTTGALIVCKNDFAHNFIAEQIKEHSVTRKYRGIVHGVVKEDTGRIELPIGRHPIDRKKMAINEKNGKDAVTHYRVLERFSKYTYMEFQLETGRTHQIRVHMARMQHPLLGDEVYGPQKKTAKLQGQTLHAACIGFVHPNTKEYVEVLAPMPPYFLELLDKLSKGKEKL